MQLLITKRRQQDEQKDEIIKRTNGFHCRCKHYSNPNHYSLCSK
ncbi:hypothetical protein LM4423_60823 [Listeria monocytogenes 4423]|nr:hypothetical protein LM4423_60823 [Listeria monocytogenes 4423]